MPWSPPRCTTTPTTSPSTRTWASTMPPCSCWQRRAPATPRPRPSRAGTTASLVIAGGGTRWGVRGGAGGEALSRHRRGVWRRRSSSPRRGRRRPPPGRGARLLRTEVGFAREGFAGVTDVVAGPAVEQRGRCMGRGGGEVSGGDAGRSLQPALCGRGSPGCGLFTGSGGLFCALAHARLLQMTGEGVCMSAPPSRARSAAARR